MKNIILTLIGIFSLFTSCVDEKKQKIQDQEQCAQNKNIEFKYDSLTLKFIDKYKNINLDKAQVFHIKKGQHILLSHKLNQQDSQLKIKNITGLQTTDTLEIKLPDNLNFKLYNFKNTPYYGGKNLLGCSLGEYMIKDKKIAVPYYDILNIY
ncbi:hypothetical protein C1637_24740 [Chryseobacterium lactis]|uniref:Lipoprotein n=1 Tax=Chryseobacterium lactis TaxID=1241981 RepID=A0A3G6RPS0_CHRLC|nr:hypothetical protein [Chryseobacterium lactis]AZA81937.1 hypothetical protein EG342_08460 [Chryseobacterium lactis]AZB06935.1 hypothetical protein EG341_24575 [Chryseobacterium lactis]PNW10985.1 hypothetical protein C1637_24740 [Chryseobacterium lactis]